MERRVKSLFFPVKAHKELADRPNDECESETISKRRDQSKDERPRSQPDKLREQFRPCVVQPRTRRRQDESDAKHESADKKTPNASPALSTFTLSIVLLSLPCRSATTCGRSATPAAGMFPGVSALRNGVFMSPVVSGGAGHTIASMSCDPALPSQQEEKEQCGQNNPGDPSVFPPHFAFPPLCV